MEENPFPDLKLANYEFLNDLDIREHCSRCGKSRKFFCYTCFTTLPILGGQIPQVTLPCKVHVIKHPGEVCGKSTAVHAAVLAPNDVTIYTFPDVPDYKDNSRVVLVYPGGNAVTLTEYMQSTERENHSKTVASSRNEQIHSAGENRGLEKMQTEKPLETTSSDNSGLKGEKSSQCNASEDLSVEPNRSSAFTIKSSYIDTVVFIDSTWFQVHKISSDPRLSNLQRIELTTHETKFWRHQLDKPTTYLSTIEAIYYFSREYHDCSSLVPYDGCYDNLLFFFCFFYQKIKTLSSKSGKKLKAYHQERRKKPKSS